MADRMIDRIHRSTGRLVRWTNAILFGAFTLGTAFVLLTLPLLKLAENPYQMLKGQTFMVNHIQLGAGQPQADPVWDGMLAGISTGYALGKGVPFMGVIAGPLLGALIGHQVDQDL